MKAISLQSGSNGNCVYVEGGGVRLLFDAGISGRAARERLCDAGRDVGSVDALLISHGHSDHIRSAGAFHRMFGLPLHMSAPTGCACEHRLGRVRGVECFAPGETLDFGALVVHTIPTPHDADGGCAFVIECDGVRLGILTDLGHVFPALPELIGSLDAVFLESNYDPEMLASGPYPYSLKQRIRGRGGHISNVESAALLRCHAGERLRWACLAHLSETNNTPELALRSHRAAWADGFPLHVASRYHASDVLEL